jgi:hypothetical protein
MPIESIEEIHNPNSKKQKPIKEKQDKYVPDIKNLNISRRNGMISVLCGSGGSGKTSLLLNQFKDIDQYKMKFHNVYYFCPSASFSSVKNHPFENHDKVYHELTIQALSDIYNQCVSMRKIKEKKIEKDKRVQFDGVNEDSDSDSDDEDEEIMYNMIIIDDFADTLKEKHIQQYLSKFLIKARHLCCGFIFTLQGYLYFPKLLRKQMTYLTMFKTNNCEEAEVIFKEVLSFKRDDALLLYDYIFTEPYSHLDVDLVENKLYKNFNLLTLKYNKKK